VRHLLPWLATWLALFSLWLLFAGEWNRQQWIAAAITATIAATVGEIARTRAGVSARVPLRWLVKGWTVPVTVVVDYGILVWALLASLVRREVVRGVFRSHPFPAGGDDPTSAGVRAWASLASMYSPNAYVVEIDQQRGLVLLHDLIPFRKSEEPA
jgi:hypothetical protein